MFWRYCFVFSYADTFPTLPTSGKYQRMRKHGSQAGNNFFHPRGSAAVVNLKVQLSRIFFLEMDILDEVKIKSEFSLPHFEKTKFVSI